MMPASEEYRRYWNKRQKPKREPKPWNEFGLGYELGQWALAAAGITFLIVLLRAIIH